MTSDRGQDLPQLPGDKLQAQLNDQVFRNASPQVIAVNPIVLTVVVIALWPEIRIGWVVAFYAGVFFTAAINTVIFAAYHRSNTAYSDPWTWHRKLIVGATLNGATWGVGLAGMLGQAQSPIGIALPLIVAAGFAGGYVAAQSASLPSVIGFMAAAFTPLVMVIIVGSGALLWAPVALIILYATLLVHFAVNSHRQIVETLTLRFQKDALLADLRAAQKNLIEARNSALALNRAKSQFLAMMSHELRTPLNAILGFADIIAKEQFGPVGQNRYKEYAQDIHESGLHLLHLVNDILDLSKIEAGRMEIAPQRLETDEVINNVVRIQRMRAKDAGVRIEVDVAPDARSLLADQRAVSQILFNLLSNALKFTPKGGVVTIRAARDSGGGIRIAVQDTGIGIAEEDLERVLKPFEQVDNSYARSTGGTGLGLPLAAALANLHGGSLNLSSEPEKGTLVEVIFPETRPPDRQQSGKSDRGRDPDTDNPMFSL